MDVSERMQYFRMDGRVERAGGMHIHNSFGGVSFTRLRLMEMSLC